MTDLEYRSFQVRAADPEARTFTGIAVPWDSPADIAGIYTERIERGAVEIPASGKVKLYWRHSEPIGLLTKYEDTDAGWSIEARISQTPRGDEAYTLLRDGVVDELSIGFVPLEHREDDETGDITRTRIEVRETSLVPFGAYGQDALVTDVRSETSASATPIERKSEMTDTNTAAEVVELRGAVEELERSIQTLGDRKDETPAVDTRSAGEIVKALASGDEATIRHYNDMQERAYEGGTLADSVSKEAWVGDLTRLVDEASTLRSLFSTGTLPSTGMNIEFAELATNSMQVTEQAAEGDDLAFGKVSVTTRTAPVKTFGGYTQLTRQEIERSSVNILDTNLRALSLEAGKRRNSSFLTHFNSAVTAQVANAVEVPASATYIDYVGAIIDAAEKFDANGLALDAYVVSKDEFKALASLSATDGRPLMTVSGTGTNVVGTINAKAITGDLAGVSVVYAPGVTSGAFVNRLAIRDYTSPIVRLQDENIVNLSKDFSLYFYSALATEIPGAIVPVVEGV